MTCRRSSTAAIAIVVLLLAQLGALVHRTAVQHVRCGHGELVEATVIAKHTPGASRFVAADGDHDAGDEHCAITIDARSDARVRSIVVVSAAQPIAHAVVFTAAPVLLATTLYRTAPKTSPPANA